VGLLDTLEELVVLGATSSSPLVGVVLEDLPAVGALDLLGGGLVAVAGYAEDGVVVLRLPVLGLAQQHLGVLGLVDVIGVLLLDALDVGLGLDALILGESALVANLVGLLVCVSTSCVCLESVHGGRKPGSEGRRAQSCGRWSC
jgi:hypothetical protein